MTDREFQALLDERDDLRRAHEDLCREINECRLSESSLEAQWREVAWRKLMSVQSKIDAELEAERTSELERP